MGNQSATKMVVGWRSKSPGIKRTFERYANSAAPTGGDAGAVDPLRVFYPSWKPRVASVSAENAASLDMSQISWREDGRRYLLDYSRASQLINWKRRGDEMPHEELYQAFMERFRASRKALLKKGAWKPGFSILSVTAKGTLTTQRGQESFVKCILLETESPLPEAFLEFCKDALTPLPPARI